MLQLREIKKDYVTASETVSALKGVSISFRQKEFVSILGPSGCGKTTLLNIIGGLDHYTSGDLIIGGRSTKSYQDRDWDVYRNHRIGFIFQSYNLIPHQTILGNVELALTISGVSREERIRKAKIALDRVGLSGQYYKKPNQLSGGQCQRVAIARALVNDPEILLADEPTGALDTVTSVQIMDLIKEISGERLVIMVTHNPEIADKYSSRIIRLLDGKVIEDTNPFSPEEEAAECEKIAKADTEELEAALATASTEKERKRIAKNKKEKAKMSFFTAFMLSAKNLISKKGRTAMVGIAGSIGIIGIALVLAFSAGIKGYIASMQDDMLSGNPIEIAESTYDLDALMGIMESDIKEDIVKQPNRVYINSLVEYLAKMNKDIDTLMVENELTKEYIDYVKSMPKEYYSAMTLGYGLDLNANLFVDYKFNSSSNPIKISVNRMTNMYTAILKDSAFADYASYITALAPSMEQLPNDMNYISGQYDIVAGRMPEGKNEILLVLDPSDELSDLLLARFGFYTQEEFTEIIKKATEEGYDASQTAYRDSFSYDELLDENRVISWYPNNTVFEEITTNIFGTEIKSIKYNSTSDNFDRTNAVDLKVVGILSPKDTISFGSLSTGIFYTEELTNHILEVNKNSNVINYLADEANKAILEASYYNFAYSYDYIGYDKTEADKATAQGTVGPTMNILASMMGSMGGSSAIDFSKLQETFVRNLGGKDIANNVLIYPKNFDEKDLVTKYLDDWNGDETITVGGVDILRENRQDVTYTDTLELIISIINTMIDVISYALIAFTSVSLVVSTVMIGIITYVSVVERIKEIGVIRSLGGRKKDVSHLFNAETFIIGLLAGIIGIGATYLISIIVNLILKPLIGYAHIAALPISNAIILVLLSIGLTLISGLIPARSAAKQDPVVALRTE